MQYGLWCDLFVNFFKAKKHMPHIYINYNAFVIL